MFVSSKKHLVKSKESYFSHAKWAFFAGFKLIYAGIGSLIHAIIPGIFTGVAAKTVIDLYHKRLINHPNKEYQDYIDSKR